MRRWLKNRGPRNDGQGMKTRGYTRRHSNPCGGGSGTNTQLPTLKKKRLSVELLVKAKKTNGEKNVFRAET